MTDLELLTLLARIKDMAMKPYPFSDGVNPDITFAFGQIIGVCHKTIEASQPASVTSTGEGIILTDLELLMLLARIRDMAMKPYPFPDSVNFYITLALGQIIGVCHKTIEACHQRVVDQLAVDVGYPTRPTAGLSP
jgi:hypothetical protein